MTVPPVEIEITGVGAGGDGLARLPGGTPCFVPRSLPGEVLRARPGARRGEGVLAEPEALLRPSPERVPPPCPHFAAGCGGCTLQHWAEAPQAAWKRRRVVDGLTRAGFPDAPVAETCTTPPGRRRRADLALRRTAEGIVLGFHLAGGPRVLDLAACPVLDPCLAALFVPLRAMLHRLPALQRQGSAVLNLLETGPDLLLRTDAALDAAGRAMLAAFAADHGIPRIAWAKNAGAPEVAAQLGPATIRFAGIPVSPPPGAFLQASPEGEAAITEAVLAALPERLPARARIAELYAGVGTLTFPLAMRARVAAFEGSAEAVAALATAARQAGAQVDAARRDLARQPLLAKELARFAAVVLDPPYAGAAEQMTLVARARVPAVVYVSCNPAALARDAKALAATGYRVRLAVPVDQFRWSTHVEAVVGFSL